MKDINITPEDFENEMPSVPIDIIHNTDNEATHEEDWIAPLFNQLCEVQVKSQELVIEIKDLYRKKGKSAQISQKAFDVCHELEEAIAIIKGRYY